MGVIKNAVASVKKAVTKKVIEKVEVVATVEVKNEVCPNCNNSGSQCSTCSPVFRDTFGE